MKHVKKPRSLGQLLCESSHLRSLLERADANSRLLQQVHHHLPPALRGHCHAAHIEAQQLVLFTDSPAWVMRLRFSSTELLGALRADRPNLRGVRVRVQLPQRPPRRPAHRPVLTEQARRQLRESAAALDEGPLRQALERLSRSR